MRVALARGLLARIVRCVPLKAYAMDTSTILWHTIHRPPICLCTVASAFLGTPGGPRADPEWE